MLNFWNAVLGLLAFVAGVFLFIFIINKRIKEEKDSYGNRFEVYSAAILCVMLGLTLLIRELMKL